MQAIVRCLIITSSLAAVLSAAPFGVAATADKQKSSTESFEGGGRACAGRLTITSKKITWNTPFSQCASLSYSILVAKADAEGGSRVFQLKNPSATCLYKFIHVEIKKKGEQIQASGFKRLQDYEQQNYDEALSCPLVAK